MRFSVVIAAYNAEATIGAAVDSALAQTLPPAEVIVADDASTDATATIAARHGATVVSRPVNGGPAAAKNTAVDAARSEWVALLDADDRWLPERLERMAPLTATAEIITTDAWVEVDGQTTRRYYGLPTGTPWYDQDQQDGIVAANFLFSHVALRRSMWIDAGGADEQLRGAPEDWELWARMILGGARAALVPEPLAVYVEQQGSSSSDRGRMIRCSRATYTTALHHPAATPAIKARAAELLAAVDRDEQHYRMQVAVAEGHPARQAAWRVLTDRAQRRRNRAEAALAVVAPMTLRKRMGDPNSTR